jgi:tetratricopeptide (TPR) repeat protein
VSSGLRRGAALLLAAAAAIPAAAADEPDFARQYEALEGQVRFVEEEYARADESQAQRAQRRFSEGEVQFLLENWDGALVRLYDAVEVPEFRASVDYPSAVYYVGEALYQEGEYRTARGWFRELLATPEAPRRREALLRSLDIAIRTNDVAGVDLLLEQGRIAFGDRPPPELAYLAAKALATRPGLPRDDRRRRAIAAFDAVPPPFQSRAAYWQGALLLETGDREGAVARFLACVQMPGREARLVEVRELCQLALGRVYADLGRPQDSADHYQEIPRDSPRFEEALYELAWTWVKAKKYEQALRAAALITDLSPDSPMAPEATILQGHLLLRMGRYPEALEAYDRVVNRYAPVRDELDALLGSDGDPARWYEAIAGGAARPQGARAGTPPPATAPGTPLPPVAVRWAASRPDVTRAIGVVGALDGSRRDVGESRLTAERIEAVLQRNDGLDAFASLKEGHGRAAAVENGALWLEGRILDAEAALAVPALRPEERAALDAAQGPRRAVERRFDPLPRTPDAVLARQERLRGRFAALDKAAFQLGYSLEASKAAVAGARAWIDARPGDLVRGGGRATALEEIRRREEEVQELERDLAALQKEIASAAVGVEGAEGTAADGALREAYRRVLDAESADLEPFRTRVPADGWARLAALEELRGKVPELLARAGRAQSRIRGQARVSAAGLRERVAAEGRRVDEHAGDVEGAQRDATVVVGGVALDSLRDVRGQFYDLVLKADVGVVDVSWQKKRERLDRIQQLAGQKAADVSSMDGEYKAVVREVQ